LTQKLLARTTPELEAIGAKVVESYKTGGLIFLQGELGAGKTTLVRGALQSLGITKPVKSPTYTIVETYNIANLTIQHFDLYRISNMEELELIGFRDYLTGYSLIFIEWPEIVQNFLPKANCKIKIDYHPEGREIIIYA